MEKKRNRKRKNEKGLKNYCALKPTATVPVPAHLAPVSLLAHATARARIRPAFVAVSPIPRFPDALNNLPARLALSPAP